MDAEALTRLPGHVLLDVARRAAARGGEDRVQDVALLLVQHDPTTVEDAVEIAARAACASRKRDSRRIAHDAGVPPEGHSPAADAALLQREALRQAVAFRTRHGRAPSRTTIWRMCRSLKQND
jgi:hypothetical protein